MTKWYLYEVAGLPETVRPLFADRSLRHWDFGAGNKPPNMTVEAPGMNPSRSERKT